MPAEFLKIIKDNYKEAYILGNGLILSLYKNKFYKFKEQGYNEGYLDFLWTKFNSEIASSYNAHMEHIQSRLRRTRI